MAIGTVQSNTFMVDDMDRAIELIDLIDGSFISLVGDNKLNFDIPDYGYSGNWVELVVEDKNIEDSEIEINIPQELSKIISDGEEAVVREVLYDGNTYIGAFTTYITNKFIKYVNHFEDIQSCETPTGGTYIEIF